MIDYKDSTAYLTLSENDVRAGYEQLRCEVLRGKELLESFIARLEPESYKEVYEFNPSFEGQ